MPVSPRHLSLALGALLALPALVVFPQAIGVLDQAPEEEVGVLAPPTFAQSVVQFAQFTGEPGIWVDETTGKRIIYVTAPQSQSSLWRSDDDGVTWTKMAGSLGGSGDSDVVTDAKGRVYVSDLLSPSGLLKTTVPLSTSLDGGNTYAHMVEMDPGAPSNSIKWDRQWTAAKGDGIVVMSARNGGTYAAWLSTNAGVSVTGPHTIATGISTGGPILFGPDGTLWAVYDTFNEVRVAKSTDNGLTWTSFKVADNSGDTYLFPAMDVDAAGNLYVAWAQGAGFPFPTTSVVVKYAMSQDGGVTWTQPLFLSQASKTAVFAWVAAGAAGKVNVAWLAMNTIGDPNLGTPVTTWDVEMAQSTNALSASPTFTKVTVAANVHQGSICTSGILCIGPQNVLGVGNVPTPFDRRHLDFFEMDVDSDGKAYVAYGKSRSLAPNTGDLLFSRIDVMVARQVGGSTVN